MDKVKVIFRKNKNNDVIAFFPEARVNYGNIMSYMHIGQHSEASYQFYVETKKADKSEYNSLLDELKRIGRKLHIRVWKMKYILMICI